MVRNSGQGPGGSPVPRVLMIAVFNQKKKVSSSGERNDVFVGGRKENFTYCSYYMWKFVVFHSSSLLLLLLL